MIERRKGERRAEFERKMAQPVMVSVPVEPTDKEILAFWGGETNHCNKKKLIDFGLQMFKVGLAASKGG